MFAKEQETFVVRYDAAGEIAGVQYLLNPLVMGLYFVMTLIGAAVMITVFLGAIVTLFQLRADPDVSMNEFLFLFYALPSFAAFCGGCTFVVRAKRYYRWFRDRPCFCFEKESLTCILRSGKKRVYLWRDLQRTTFINHNLVFEPGGVVVLPDAFWKTYYSDKIFVGLLGFSLASFNNEKTGTVKPLAVHRDSGGNICRIEYKPTAKMFMLAVIAYFMVMILSPVFFLKVLSYVESLREDIVVGLELQVILLFCGLCVVGISCWSCWSMFRYFIWLIRMPRYTATREALICEDRRGKPIIHRWETLKKESLLRLVFAFSSGARILIPADYTGAVFAAISRLSGIRIRERGSALEADGLGTRKLFHRHFSVQRDSGGKVCCLTYAPNVLRMVLMVVVAALFLSPMLVVLAFVIFGTLQEEDMLLFLVLIVFGLIGAAPALVWLRTYGMLLWARPRYVFTRECLEYMDRYGVSRRFSWTDLDRIGWEDERFVFKSGGNVYVPEEFWTECYDEAVFFELLGDVLALKLRNRCFSFLGRP